MEIDGLGPETSSETRARWERERQDFWAEAVARDPDDANTRWLKTESDKTRAAIDHATTVVQKPKPYFGGRGDGVLDLEEQPDGSFR